MIGSEITAFLFLFVVVLWAHLWFHIVEAIWKQIKKRLSFQKDPPVWHPYPDEQEDTNSDHNDK